MSLVGWLKAVRIHAGLRTESESASRPTDAPVSSALPPDPVRPPIGGGGAPASRSHFVGPSRLGWQDADDDDDD
jgi:hypothetical protein